MINQSSINIEDLHREPLIAARWWTNEIGSLLLFASIVEFTCVPKCAILYLLCKPGYQTIEPQLAMITRV